MAASTYDLVYVGTYGRKLHAIDPNDTLGRVLCETRTSHRSKHRATDGSGGYSDHSQTAWSAIRPTGRRGRPTCTDCLRYL